MLLQSGKSGDLAAAFGGQGSQTAFGPRGAASVLSRATTWSAIIFMLTSITLSIFAARRTGPTSVFSGVKPSQTKSQPATPAPSRAADGSAEPGANPEIKCSWIAGRPQPGQLELHRDAVACHLIHDLVIQEGILFPFLSNGCSRAMARNHDRLIRQGQDAVVQRAHDLLERSSGEIGASDAAGEQRVAGNQ